MKKVYRFNLIPGVEFIEDDGYYYSSSVDPDCASTVKATIKGLTEYDNTIAEQNALIKEKDKKIEEYKKINNELTKKLKNHEFVISVLNNRIDFIKKSADNEIDHRNKLLDEKDKEIEAYKEANKTLKGENNNLIDLIAQSPISKSPIPLSSAEDCSDFYICAPDHITYGPIAGGFGIGLYVGDTLILLKGDKASEAVYERNAMIDKINALESTLKKKDEKIKDLRNTTEFANNICDGYGALTSTLMSSIEEKNSEIKVLSGQVTSLMDQLKKVMEWDSGCKSCSNGPEPCCDICGNTDCEHRVKTEAKPKTNFDKLMSAMHDQLSPARLAEIIKTSECDGVSCKDCLFNSIAEPGYLPICDMPRKALTEWLSENSKED